MARPVIALLTDFGLRDHYVAAMKGVILGICPEATIIDISHDIAPQDVLGGALELEAVVPYLPAGTVVTGVVDPGVGSSRRGVAIKAGPIVFVGPDNGLFSLALRDAVSLEAVELVNARFAREVVTRTFEGRDRFAPAAAWLASGVGLMEFGPVVTDLVRIDVPSPSRVDDGLDGIVLRIDRFGNLITNVHRRDLTGLGYSVETGVANVVITTISSTYAEVPQGEVCALIGSGDMLEIAVNGGNAAATLGAACGARVRVRRRSAA